jgi:hypothetical protein
MRRADRRNSSYDNAQQHPRSRQQEPASNNELKQALMTARANCEEAKQQQNETATELNQVKEQLQVDVTRNHQLYQQTLLLYEEEKTKAAELLTKYNEVLGELQSERRSKAGIKGWETRRKKENERLKSEIGEMVVLLHESLANKDEAVKNLYTVADRMDRIQRLVDSVEEETTGTPVGLLRRLGKIWVAIKDILAE